MNEYAIEIEGLIKVFDDGVSPLKGLTMKVPKGSVYGFIGRNGAGKTTTLKTLMGLLQPSAGSAKLLGENSWGVSPQTKEKIGYMPEVSFVFPWMRIGQMFEFMADFYPKWDPKQAEVLTQSMGLMLEQKLSKLSLGQTRMVSLIIAVAINPDLLILDEPAGNLDVVTRRKFLDQIIEFTQAQDRTVLISSHILTDLERVIDHVGIIDCGIMKMEARLDELKDKVKRVRLLYDREPPAQFEIPNVIRTERNGREVLLTVSEFDEKRLAQSKDLYGARIEVQAIGLEDIFVDYAA